MVTRDNDQQRPMRYRPTSFNTSDKQINSPFPLLIPPKYIYIHQIAEHRVSWCMVPVDFNVRQTTNCSYMCLNTLIIICYLGTIIICHTILILNVLRIRDVII